MKKKFSIDGMSCTNCVSSIERKLINKKGINSINVSLMGKSMVVDYDEKLISSKDICTIVKKIGYVAFEEGKGQTYDEAKRMKKRFIFSMIFLLPLIYFAMGEMFNLPVPNYLINLPLQFGLSVIIIAINFKFYINGAKAVLNGYPNMDTLVSLGSFSALVYSVVQTIIVFATKKPAHLFFESSAMVLTLVTLGKWIEENGKKKTGKEVEKMLSLLPEEVNVMIDGEVKSVSSFNVNVGDVVVLRVGDFVCFDGVVVKGFGGIDKSAITGESVPEEVYEGKEIVSGSVLKSGYVLYQVLKSKEASKFSKIIEIVRNAEATKVPAQKLADKVARIFVPTVVVISLIVFALWLFFGGVFLAFKYSISVLVISCPCSLGLATPVAIMVSMGKSAECGVLFKDAECLQKLSKVNAVFMDKTATLTKGNLDVVAFENYSTFSDEKIKSIAYSIENMANHPLSNAIKDFCGETGDVCEKFEYVLGKGVVGEVDGTLYRLGSFVNFEKHEKFTGKTLVIMSDVNDVVLAVFAISDQLKSDSRFTVEFLNREGVKTFMITGDNNEVAKDISRELNLDGYFSNALPEQKAEIILRNKKDYYTAYVGDGINDSPALKTAEVGVAMGSGTDIAIESSDVVLVNGNPSSLVDAIMISKKTIGIIKLNLFWAFLYNVLAIPIAGGVLSFINVSLTPGLASLCMCFSSIFVVQNALKIRSYKKINTDKEDKAVKIYVDGMMCLHCAGKVKEVLLSIDGVKEVDINLKKKVALVNGQFDFSIAKQRIEEAGYKVIKFKE